jgi:hypothetical protein
MLDAPDGAGELQLHLLQAEHQRVEEPPHGLHLRLRDETRRDGTGRARSSFPDDGRDLRRRGARSARRGEAEEEGVELGR